MTASSVTCCSLTARVAWARLKNPSARLREVCRRITSLLPMRREANSDVPPRSLAGAAEYQRVAAVLHQRLGFCVAVGAAHLGDAAYKRYVLIGEGTHSVIMEKNRMQLFQAVQQFSV